MGAEIDATGWGNEGVLWARPLPNQSQYVAGKTFGTTRPALLYPNSYAIQRKSSLLNAATVANPNGSEYGLQVTNKIGTVIYDSRKSQKGIEVKKVFAVGSLPGGSFFGGYADTSSTENDNLVYTAASDAEFEKIYVTVIGGFFANANTVGSAVVSGQPQTQLNGFYFDKTRNKIFFHSVRKVATAVVFDPDQNQFVKQPDGVAGGVGSTILTFARPNNTEILVGELIG